MIPILMYHQVAEISKKLDPSGMAVSPGRFEQQMSFLARNGYRCLTLPEALQYFQNGKSTPARSFVLTFDDGYQNVLSMACPILEKFGFTATIFLVAGRMGSLSNWWGQDGARSGLLLLPAEARDVARRGHILGSHTVSHPFLTLLDDLTAYEEIRNSKVLLQNQLDMQVDFFSYPFSETESRIEKLVESAGYTAACAGDSGSSGVFHLWRVPILKGDTMLSFALKVSGWYDKKTALRESAPGQFLRRSVHTTRRWLKIRHPSRNPVLNPDLSRGSERQP